MVTINSVHPDDAAKLCQEFFTPESLAERLGTAGHWQGMGVGRLGLANPVQEAAFANLLAGRTPDGTRSLLADAPGPERPAAWRLSFDTSPSVSVLWAMAPPASGGIIERVHAECVEAAMIDFEQQLCRHTIGVPQPSADQFLGGLFASFRQGAAWDQTPRLHTTVFCLNLGLGPDGQAHVFQPRQDQEMKDEVSPYYRRILESGLLDGLRRWEQLKDAARSKVSTALEALFGCSEGRKPPTQGPAHGSKPRRSRPSQSQDQGHSH